MLVLILLERVKWQTNRVMVGEAAINAIQTINLMVNALDAISSVIECSSARIGLQMRRGKASFKVRIKVNEVSTTIITRTVL